MPRILIVDDNATNREIVREVLLDSNYELDEAVDGHDAVAKSVAMRPDLILLDFLMPNLDGLETMRRLRATPQTANVPIIMVSALGQDSHLALCLDEGAIDYIVRPFSHIVLRARVRAALGRVDRNVVPTKRVKARSGQNVTEGTTRVKSKRAARSGKLICVIGAKGGVGASYVALTLAALSASEKKQSVNVVELRSWPGTLGSRLGLTQCPTIADLAKVGKRRYSCDDVKGSMVEHASGLHLLLAPMEAKAMPEITASMAEGILCASSELADCTIVDLPSVASSATRRAISLSDQTILVIEHDLVCLTAARGWISRFDAWGISSSALSVVIVCKGDAEAALDHASLHDAVGATIVGVVQPDPDGALLATRLARGARFHNMNECSPATAHDESNEMNAVAACP